MPFTSEHRHAAWHIGCSSSGITSPTLYDLPLLWHFLSSGIIGQSTLQMKNRTFFSLVALCVCSCICNYIPNRATAVSLFNRLTAKFHIMIWNLNAFRLVTWLSCTGTEKYGKEMVKTNWLSDYNCHNNLGRERRTSPTINRFSHTSQNSTKITYKPKHFTYRTHINNYRCDATDHPYLLEIRRWCCGVGTTQLLYVCANTICVFVQAWHRVVEHVGWNIVNVWYGVWCC